MASGSSDGGSDAFGVASVPARISLTEKQIFTALRGVLADFLTPGIPIIRAQVNRVPEPAQADFVLMSPIRRERLATNIVAYHDDPITPANAVATLEMPTEITYQLDVHGPASTENAQIIATVLRSEQACDAFAATGHDIAPLYASDPHEMPFINAEQQFEWRWIVEACIQANIIVTLPQQFADKVTVTPIPIDLEPDFLIPVP